MTTKKQVSRRKIETTIHTKDKRTNIPTKELGGFVKEHEDEPARIRYPRDTSLDPQLVWRGKDEQDSEDLEVPAVPVYIQEKIHPKYIVEDLRAQANKEKPEQLQFFADFNGLEFQDLIEFYQHEQSWANRMILGDSLLVMNSLAEKEGLRGKVQMIYIDPPYGIGFASNWQVSTRKRDVRDGKAEDTTRQPEQIRAFRDTWKDSIHSYLAYLRDRLVVACALLSETGSIFVQIGDENVHLVRCLMDEVFGSENFLSIITFTTSVPLGATYVPGITNYLLWYAKDARHTKFRRLYTAKAIGAGTAYSSVELPDGTRRGMTAQEQQDPSLLPEGSRYFFNLSLLSAGTTTTCVYDFEYAGRKFSPGGGRSWKTTKDGMVRLGWANRIFVAGNTPRYVLYSDDYPVSELTNNWTDTGGATDKVYVVQTMTKVVERCLLMTTDPGDLVLDPTGGSATTAYVAEQWGRRWIYIDTSRVALALARTRVMSARYPYYLLADSPEGIKTEAEITGQVPPAYQTAQDIRKGFVYRRVPHITLRSIVNNPDIKEGMTREEVDAAIARYTETETLYDRPYEDTKRIRVTGPFTVESLSPHRVISASEEMPATELEVRRKGGTGSFEAMILDNLRKAGVQNTIRNERLMFDQLEPYPGQWLHARGEYTEKDGAVRRVAVCIGPEHSTLTSDVVKEAAKEAVRGTGFDLLVVCGFAFDAYVSEEAKQFGRLNILITRMNPDLAMGDELLKTTNTANLFMVFGEPDVDIKKQDDGKTVVIINGVDVYDPTTGNVRNHATADIACWFIDTDYNEESFFVRHAYFLGGGEPYEKLKRSLKADIDEAAWASLYSATSRPFDPPTTGKIAIKVINHYGDEVLKVYEVA